MGDELLWNIAWMTPAFCGAAVIVFMVYVLIGYMVVEIRAMIRINRTRQSRDERVMAARKEIQRRERRLATQKAVMDAIKDGDILYYEDVRETLQNGIN